MPSLLGDGEKGIEIVYGEEKKIVCAGPTRADKAVQNYLVPARQVQRTEQERTPFHLSSLSPHSPKFQQSAGANPL
jgi:hypothetical protein